MKKKHKNLSVHWPSNVPHLNKKYDFDADDDGEWIMAATQADCKTLNGRLDVFSCSS